MSTELGETISEHRFAGKRPSPWLFVFVLPGGFMAWISSITWHSSAGASLFTGAMAALFLGIPAWAVFLAVKHRELLVSAHPRGLRERRAGQERTFLWEELVAVRGTSELHVTFGDERAPPAKAHVYRWLRDGALVAFRDAIPDERRVLTELCDLRLMFKKERELRLTHELERVGALVEHTLREMAARLRPAITKRLGAGKKVSFGPVAISKEGLDASGKTFAWEEIAALRLTKGVLTLQLTASSRDLVDCAEVENVSLFLELVEDRFGITLVGDTRLP